MSDNNNSRRGIIPSSLFVFISSAIKIYGKNRVGVTILNKDGDTKYTLLSDGPDSHVIDLPFTPDSIERILGEIENPIIEVMVWFPAVYITNSQHPALKHKIRDLYVTTSIEKDYDDDVHVNIFGNRGTFTKDEVLADYAHSHLNGYGYGYSRYRRFCLGTANIVTVKSDIGNMLLNSDSTSAFKNAFIFKSISYFEELRNMVKIESEEGGPYRRIMGFARRDSGSPVSAHTYAAQIAQHSDLEEFLEKAPEAIEIYLKNMSITPYFSKHSSFPEIKFNDPKILFELHKIDIQDKYQNYELSMENPNIVLYVNNRQALSAVTLRHPTKEDYIPFKGKNIPVKLIKVGDTTGQSIKVISPRVHATMKGFIKSILTREFIERNQVFNKN